jgi:hypothetical protein
MIAPRCSTLCGAAPSPTPSPSSSGLFVQSAFDTLTEDFFTESAAFVPLDDLAVSMATGEGFLLVSFAVTFLGPNPGQPAFNAFFSVRLDGVQVIQRGSIASFDPNQQPDSPTVTAFGRVPVSAGNHIVEVFVATDGGAGNPLRIDAGSTPQIFGADLLVQEVRA